MTSKETTLIGIIVAVIGVALVAVLAFSGESESRPEAWAMGLGLIATGVGLVRARDNNMTSEQAGAGTKRNSRLP